MATDYFSDNEVFISNHPLPPSADTPYSSLSRRTSRYGTPVSDISGSPAPFPAAQSDHQNQAGNDEEISPLDPRRFTPTLHASLVSEILNLRRELDSKHNVIEDLETNLSTLRDENESLVGQVSSSSRENKSVRRQLQQLENGTLSALEEIVGERNKAQETNADLRQKLEATQKKLRSQEEDSTRVHDMWAREKEAWEGEKRALERRVHVSESRLKMILEELAVHEAVEEDAALPESETEDNARDTGLCHESDAGSLRSSPVRRPSTRITRHSRNHSNGSFRSVGRGYRISLMSGAGSEHGRLNGLSLADELIFDEEDEDLDELELDSDDFPENEMRARRALESRQSMRQDDKAKRVLGLNLENQQIAPEFNALGDEIEPSKTHNGHYISKDLTGSVPREVTPDLSPAKPLYVDGGAKYSPPRARYADGGVQYSPTRTQYVDTGVRFSLLPKPEYVDSGVQHSPPPKPEYVDSGMQHSPPTKPQNVDSGVQCSPRAKAQNVDNGVQCSRPPSLYNVESGMQSSLPPKPQYVDSGVQYSPLPKPENVDSGMQHSPPPKPRNVDSGVQYSPPSSPVQAGSAASVTPSAKACDVVSVGSDVEANQSRKRVSVQGGLVSPQAPSVQLSPLMTSAASQTTEQPLSPPATPIIATAPEKRTESESTIHKPEVASVSTQTEAVEAPRVQPPPPPRSPRRPKPQPMPIAIPSIAIHAPTSAPPSPKEPILPPGTKNISTQTTSEMTSSMRSIGMQTEPIRIDQRPVKLPAHLLPSAISSKPGTPEPAPGLDPAVSVAGNVTRKDSHQPVSPSTEKPVAVSSARQDLIALLEKSAERSAEKSAEREIEDRYPGNNDNGPLGRDKDNGISRPFRTSSLFAGFDEESSEGEGQDMDLSDEEDVRGRGHAAAMVSSRNVKSGRVFSSPPTPVPEEKAVISRSRLSQDSTSSARILSNRSSMERPVKVGKAVRTSLTRQPSVRRTVMIQKGPASTVQRVNVKMGHVRSRSPSLGSIGSIQQIASLNASSVSVGGSRPPFPVPTRSSSRNMPLSKSEGSESPTPRGYGGFPGGVGGAKGLGAGGPVRRPYGSKQYQHQRKDSLRKVRSAAIIHRPVRPRSRSPPLPLSETPDLPESPSLSPRLTDTVFGHRSQLSTNTSNTAYTGNTGNTGNTSHTGHTDNSLGSLQHQTSVVDAIAATMVGEWMWKYVRKRKTFGGPESPADLARSGDEASIMNSNGVRHKRWVWISPYERSVLWSSKQPTSSSALIGKSGRKLTIQSVLDVADSTPIPKSAGTETIFNRSILILTPARALKFTAATRERHYLWLTALSFLAHSSTPIPEMEPPLPPAPPPVEQLNHRPSGATLRRSHVRDSVRLAKNKANPVAQRHAVSRLEPMPDFITSAADDYPVPDAASPPTIHRGPVHGRKRSSTGPSAPPPSVPYRSFSHQHVPSIYSSGSSDMYTSNMPPSVPSSIYNPHSGIPSARTSEASTSTRQHFFDTMGTVRMEAFIDNALGGPDPMKHNPAARARGGRRRDDVRTGGGMYDDFLHESNDPFRGF